MSYEDYVPESEYYDPEADLFAYMITAEPWDNGSEDEWSYSDLGDYYDIDAYDEY